MASASFGYPHGEFDFIQKAFEVLPILKGDEAQIALNMLFDQFFGLQYFQPETSGPLSSIALTAGEEYGRSGPLYAAMELYAKSAIPTYFPGLSVDQYLALPKEMTVWLLEISERQRADKAQTEQDLINRMNLTAGQPPR